MRQGNVNYYDPTEAERREQERMPCGHPRSALRYKHLPAGQWRVDADGLALAPCVLEFQFCSICEPASEEELMSCGHPRSALRWSQWPEKVPYPTTCWCGMCVEIATQKWRDADGTE